MTQIDAFRLLRQGRRQGQGDCTEPIRAPAGLPVTMAGLFPLLFAGGVMNLYWIVGLSVYVLAEKLLPGGQRIGLWVGAAVVLWGAAALGGLLQIP